MTPRELVNRTLDLAQPARAPRQLWALPWAEMHHPGVVAGISADYPDDIAGAPGYHRDWELTHGDAYEVGEYIDAWGCVFENKQRGVIGEVKQPIVEDWSDTSRVHFPLGWLSIDVEKISAWCRETDRFTMAGCCPRPFEQLQFMRGTENLLVDLALGDEGLMAFVARLHAFYCEEFELWAQSEVDAMMFMDDWGSQQTLLASPALWRAVFKPLYRDYVRIAHEHGKRAFMHSDGHILAVIPDLIEIGLDAVNSQIFCMGLDQLSKYAGQITFWGEIDRQHLLPEASTAEIDQAVRDVHAALWRDGGCIAQCEFGAGARPENVRQVFASWDAVTGLG